VDAAGDDGSGGGDDASNDDVRKLGDASGDGGKGADADAAVDANGPFLVFVSSRVYAGSTLADGDAKCMALAKALALPGNFSAWLSYSDAGASAVERITGLGPWIDRKGNTIFADRTDLVSGAPKHQLVLTEDGGNYVDQLVWTGTHPNGTLALNCANWSKSAIAGSLGGAGELDGRWTEEPSQSICSTTHSIYCFQHP